MPVVDEAHTDLVTEKTGSKLLQRVNVPAIPGRKKQPHTYRPTRHFVPVVVWLIGRSGPCSTRGLWSLLHPQAAASFTRNFVV